MSDHFPVIARLVQVDFLQRRESYVEIETEARSLIMHGQLKSPQDGLQNRWIPKLWSYFRFREPFREIVH